MDTSTMTYRTIVSDILRRGFLAILASCFALAAEASDDVLLTIYGPNETILASFTDAELLAFEQHEFETGTTWTEGVNSYSGPALSDVIAPFLEKKSFEAKLTAANDYAVTINQKLIDDTYPIIALRLNAEPFSVREKGPLWVIYPFDTENDYRTEKHYSASIWQLKTIDLAPE